MDREEFIVSLVSFNEKTPVRRKKSSSFKKFGWLKEHSKALEAQWKLWDKFLLNSLRRPLVTFSENEIAIAIL